MNAEINKKIGILQRKIFNLLEKFEEETDLMVENALIHRIDDDIWNELLKVELEVKIRRVL